MAIEVVPLTEADIPGAIKVIQEAFKDDPYFNWAFDASTVCPSNQIPWKNLGRTKKKKKKKKQSSRPAKLNF